MTEEQYNTAIQHERTRAVYEFLRHIPKPPVNCTRIDMQFRYDDNAVFAIELKEAAQLHPATGKSWLDRILRR